MPNLKWDSEFISLNNINFHYIRTKNVNKPPFVMAHGFTDNCWCLEPIAEKFVDKFNIIIYDARGHGLTDAPSIGYDAKTMTSDLIELCNELEIKSPVLYGHSLGANTVARAANSTMSVHALILEDPAGQKVNNYTSRINETKLKLKNYRLSTHKELKSEYNEKINLSDHIATARKQLRPEVINIDKRGYDYIDNIIEKDICPTLILRPDSDVVDYLKPERDKNISFDNVYVKNVPNSSHIIFRDNPKETTKLINEFLRKN